MDISTATTSIAKSGQDIMAASTQMLSNVPEPADQQLYTAEAQTKTEPQSTEGDYAYSNDHQFQKFLRRVGGKRKGPQSSKPTRQGACSPKYYESAQKRRREQSDGPRKRVADTLAQSTIIENMRRPDVFLENGDTNDSDDTKDDGNSTDSDKYQATSMDAPGLDLARDKHLEHWRAWCQRKRYPDDMITGEKYGTYMKESLSPMVYRYKNNPYLEILPIRVDSSYNEEGEIPAWEDVVCHISSIRSLYLSQCEGNGVRPDIDGTMARPETVAAISKFRSIQEMPQFVQEESYQPILRNSLRYLWMKGYRDQECNHLNQWCGTRTRLCLAFDRFKGPKHVFRHTLLTSLYPVYYTDQIKQREVFGLAIAKPTFGRDTSNDQPFTRLFRHSDVEICPLGCLAIYMFAQWMDDAQVPNFQQHKWHRWHGRYLLHSRDNFKMIADSTYKRYVGVALGMAKTEAAAAVINPREQGVGAEEVRGFHYNDNTIATDTPLKSYSLTDDSASEPYKLAANLRLPGEYLVIRDAIIPPLELQRQIFPFIEKLFPDNDDWKIWIDNIMMNRPEYTGRPRNQNNHYPKDVSPAIRLMIVLAHLRKIILQDIVALKLCTKDFLVVGNTTHQIADSPVFSSQAFLRFTHQLQEAIQSKSGRAQAAESSGGPIKTHLSRQDIPLADVVLPIATDYNHLSSSSQLPTPPKDGEVDTTPLNAISPEPAIQTQQLTSNQQNNKQQSLPQELLAIRPTENDDPDILEIKMSLASMFRYMETESKAVSHFASATFSSLEQLQRQVAGVENTAQVLLEKEVAADSKSVERHVPESALYHSPQQDAGNLEQWLQQQNEIRPWRKGIQQGTGAQHLEQRLSRSAVSVGETQLSGDSETRRGGLLNMNTLRENMSRSKALNQDVNRRISNLEAELLAVGRNLRAVVGVGVTEEWSGVEAQARDEGEEDSGERDEPSDEEEDGHQDENWEPSRTRTRTRTGTRTGSSKAETKKRDEKRTALKSFYPENLVALADQIAALYPQLKEDKVRAIHLPITRSQISLALPTTLKDVWVEHFSAKGSQPSFWSLEAYVDAWRSELNELHSTTLSRKRVIIAVILKEIGRTKGSSLKAREEKALAALSVTTSKKKSLYHFYNQHSSGGIFRKRLVNKH